jgi:hypothetical protein
MKLEELLNDIKSGKKLVLAQQVCHTLCHFKHLDLYNMFTNISLTSKLDGKVLHTIEFQKLGLPHVHIIFWVSTDTSQPTPEQIDSIISAEIPDPTADPLAYALVGEHMVHEPCGKLNPNSPCMKNRKCSKYYPKPFHDQTTINENGYATYKRRNDGRFVLKGSTKLDNRWIVPHNPILLKNIRLILMLNGATKLFL